MTFRWLGGTGSPGGVDSFRALVGVAFRGVGLFSVLRLYLLTGEDRLAVLGGPLWAGGHLGHFFLAGAALLAATLVADFVRWGCPPGWLHRLARGVSSVYGVGGPVGLFRLFLTGGDRDVVFRFGGARVVDLVAVSHKREALVEDFVRTVRDAHPAGPALEEALLARVELLREELTDAAVTLRSLEEHKWDNRGRTEVFASWLPREIPAPAGWVAWLADHPGTVFLAVCGAVLVVGGVYFLWDTSTVRDELEKDRSSFETDIQKVYQIGRDVHAAGKKVDKKYDALERSLLQTMDQKEMRLRRHIEDSVNQPLTIIDAMSVQVTSQCREIEFLTDQLADARALAEHQHQVTSEAVTHLTTMTGHLKADLVRSINKTNEDLTFLHKNHSDNFATKRVANDLAHRIGTLHQSVDELQNHANGTWKILKDFVLPK